MEDNVLPAGSFADIAVDLRSYFSSSDLEKMAALEQLAMVNRIKNYKVLHQLGLPTTPLEILLKKKSAKRYTENFNAKRKFKDDDVSWKPSMENPIINTSSARGSKTNKRCLEKERPRERRYPKRGVPIGVPLKSYCEIDGKSLGKHEECLEKTDQKENEDDKVQIKFYYGAYESDDADVAFYCDYCRLVYPGERRCYVHVEVTLDTEKTSEELQRLTSATATLPDGLIIRNSSTSDTCDGVFTDKDTSLKRGLIFGPFAGVKIHSKAEAQRSGNCWQIFNNEGKVSHYIDAQDPQNSNWMRYINCATSRASRNLMAFQSDGNIFYKTVVDIGPDTALCIGSNARESGLVDGLTSVQEARLELSTACTCLPCRTYFRSLTCSVSV